MAKELTQDEITSRELERLVSKVEQRDLREQIQNAMSKLELHKSYGLRFERHIPEVITHDGKTIELGSQYFPWLRKVEQVQGTKPKGPEHILMESDNYVALKYLQYTHQGRVDVIYIDPPYNTGAKDWKYNDCYVDSEDPTGHSKWLSFMEKRLKLARKLLSPTGLIAIQIDENEQAALKLLCDDIFQHHVATLHVHMSAVQGMKVRAAKNGAIVKNAEYVLLYSPSKDFRAGRVFYDQSNYDAHYNLFVKKVNGLYEESSLIDILKSDPKTGSFAKGCSNKDLPDLYKIKEVKEFIHVMRDHVMRDDNSEQTLPVTVRHGEIVEYHNGTRSYLVTRNSAGKLRQRIPLKDKLQMCDGLKPEVGNSTIRGDWWPGYYLDMGNVSKEGGITFANGKKPSRLIKHLIELGSNKKDAIVLDFFAGSGTTMQATACLNTEDGGTRQAILITNSEAGKAKIIQGDPEGIARSVTWPRITNVCEEHPSAHATFYTMEIYGEDEIERVSRGWKQNMEGYLPLLSTKLNVPSNWKRIPETKGFSQGKSAIVEADEVDYDVQQFLKAEGIHTLAIVSDDKDEFNLVKTRCQKTTKVKQFLFLPREYTEYFESFHTKE